jgi:hypothetical protein
VRLLCLAAGARRERQDPEVVVDTMVAKYFAAGAAVRAATDAVQIHAANGCHADSPIQRLFRDAESMEIIEGAPDSRRWRSRRICSVPGRRMATTHSAPDESTFARPRQVKDLVWDLDDTLRDGVLLEGGVRIRTAAADAIRALDRRDILQSIASRNERGWTIMRRATPARRDSRSCQGAAEGCVRRRSCRTTWVHQSDPGPRLLRA